MDGYFRRVRNHNSGLYLHSIKTVVLDHLYGRTDESATCCRIRDEVEVALLRICPAAYRKKDFDVSRSSEPVRTVTKRRRFHEN